METSSQLEVSGLTAAAGFLVALRRWPVFSAHWHSAVGDPSGAGSLTRRVLDFLGVTGLCPTPNWIFLVFLWRKVEPNCFPLLASPKVTSRIRGIFLRGLRYSSRGVGGSKRPNSTHFQTLKIATVRIFSLQAVEILNCLGCNINKCSLMCFSLHSTLILTMRGVNLD